MPDWGDLSEDPQFYRCVEHSEALHRASQKRVWLSLSVFLTHMEGVAQAVESPILDKREDAVLLEDLYLDYYETLICETILPPIDGQTVICFNPVG